MSNFRTNITPEKYSFEISQKDKIISIGSCFSENIGQKFKELKFDISINPHGILFNPISIFNSIEDVFNKKMYTEKDIDFNKEIFFSYNHHSSYSSLNKEEVIKKTNNSISDNYDYLNYLNNHSLITGYKVCFDGDKNGIVKSPISEYKAFVVFNYNNDVEGFENYTAENTPLHRVRLGWADPIR